MRATSLPRELPRARQERDRREHKEAEKQTRARHRQTRVVDDAGRVFTGLILPRSAGAEKSRLTFEEWIAAFQSKALARGITPETYARVMGAIKPVI